MNYIITQLNSITIQKEIGKQECSIKISAPDTMNVELSTSSLQMTNFRGQVLKEIKLHWKDMFTDGVQIFLEGIFKDQDSGIATVGKYDLFNNILIEMGD